MFPDSKTSHRPLSPSLTWAAGSLQTALLLPPLLPCQLNFGTEGGLMLSKSHFRGMTSLLWIQSEAQHPSTILPPALTSATLPCCSAPATPVRPPAQDPLGAQRVFSLCLEHSPVVTTKLSPSSHLCHSSNVTFLGDLLNNHVI